MRSTSTFAVARLATARGSWRFAQQRLVGGIELAGRVARRVLDAPEEQLARVDARLPRARRGIGGDLRRRTALGRIGRFSFDLDDAALSPPAFGHRAPPSAYANQDGPRLAW